MLIGRTKPCIRRVEISTDGTTRRIGYGFAPPPQPHDDESKTGSVGVRDYGCRRADGAVCDICHPKSSSTASINQVYTMCQRSEIQTHSRLYLGSLDHWTLGSAEYILVYLPSIRTDMPSLKKPLPAETMQQIIIVSFYLEAWMYRIIFHLIVNHYYSLIVLLSFYRLVQSTSRARSGT